MLIGERASSRSECTRASARQYRHRYGKSGRKSSKGNPKYYGNKEVEGGALLDVCGHNDRVNFACYAVVGRNNRLKAPMSIVIFW